MRVVSHISTARTKVREGELSRHLGARLDGGKAFVVTTGLGLPRTWWLANQALVRGFEFGFRDAPPGKKKGDRLIAAADRARRELADVCEQLVEHALPDAAFAAVAIEDGTLQVVSAGPCRVYLHRTGKPQRLTPRDEPREGTLRARVTQCATTLEPGDLIMAGSVSAFSRRSIAQVVTVLQDDPRTEPPILASLLTEPAAQAGVGAAAIVIRVL